MSFGALAWAAKATGIRPAEKLVLLGLAECASRDNGDAYPSVAALVEFAGLNRKTVIAALDSLIFYGLISETGESRGKTNQIKVYRLALETVPKVERSQKRNSPVFSGKESQKRDTDTVREPVKGSEAKASSPKRAIRKPVLPDRPDDVDDSVWTDFHAVRKAHRAPLTDTALRQIKLEADKAGWTLEQALRECCQRGWRGFKADWIKDSHSGRQLANTVTSLRGTRPDPAYDLWAEAQRELAAEAQGIGEDQEHCGSDWLSLPAVRSG